MRLLPRVEASRHRRAERRRQTEAKDFLPHAEGYLKTHGFGEGLPKEVAEGLVASLMLFVGHTSPEPHDVEAMLLEASRALAFAQDVLLAAKGAAVLLPRARPRENFPNTIFAPVYASLLFPWEDGDVEQAFRDSYPAESAARLRRATRERGWWEDGGGMSRWEAERMGA